MEPGARAIWASPPRALGNNEALVYGANRLMGHHQQACSPLDSLVSQWVEVVPKYERGVRPSPEGVKNQAPAEFFIRANDIRV